MSRRVPGLYGPLIRARACTSRTQTYRSYVIHYKTYGGALCSVTLRARTTTDLSVRFFVSSRTRREGGTRSASVNVAPRARAVHGQSSINRVIPCIQSYRVRGVTSDEYVF